MQKGTNFMIKEAKDAIAKTVNETGLPISILTMILKELFLEASSANEQAVAREEKEYNNALTQEGVSKAAEERSETV